MKISNKTYDIIKSIKNKLGFCKLALIDPDLKNDFVKYHDQVYPNNLI